MVVWMAYPISRSRSMSRRTVRSLICRRSARSGPGQSRRVCSSESSFSNREVVVTPEDYDQSRTEVDLHRRKAGSGHTTDGDVLPRGAPMTIQTTTHLNFRGDARAALGFYQ